MSDTPRTDKVLANAPKHPLAQIDSTTVFLFPPAMDLLEFARQLEREIAELERQIERMNELYEQARTVCRYSGVDQFRFDNALRRLWETVGEIQKLKEQEE